MLELTKEILRCEKCPELVSGRLYPMPYFKGNNYQKILGLGQNPGLPQSGEFELLKELDYDYKKHLDIGFRSSMMGKFVKWAFEKTPISLDNLIFTNVLKCSTPENRAPTKSEINRCSKFLRRQLEIFDPELIITFGKVAANFFNIKKINKIYEVKSVDGSEKSIILSLYHPSYLRRVGNFSYVQDLILEAFTLSNV